jgi:hypothetical protein
MNVKNVARLAIQSTLTVAFVFLTLSAAQAGPSKFSPADGSFSVAFPASPECVQQKVAIATGEVVMHRCSHADVAAQLFYSVIYYDGLLVPTTVDTHTALKGALDGAVATSKSTLIDSHDAKVSGYPAIESLMTAPDGLHTISQHVLARQRLLVVEISGWRGRMPPEAVSGFLDSFIISSGTP